MMQNEQRIKLVDGIFSVEDANLLLLELLRFKIGFHEQRLFRDYKEFNQDYSNSKKRIEALNKSLENFRGLIAKAYESDSLIEINCEIEIKTKQPHWKTYK